MRCGRLAGPFPNLYLYRKPVQCYEMLCIVIQFSAMQCCVMQGNELQYSWVQGEAGQYKYQIKPWEIPLHPSQQPPFIHYTDTAGWPAPLIHYTTLNYSTLKYTTPGMSRTHFFNFGTGTGKPKKTFPMFRTWTGNTRNHSCRLGQEQEIQETIPVVWNANGKYKKPFT